MSVFHFAQIGNKNSSNLPTQQAGRLTGARLAELDSKEGNSISTASDEARTNSITFNTYIGEALGARL